MQNQIFKVGDVVTDGGLEGIVLTEAGEDVTLPIEVCFRVTDFLQSVQKYTRDGKTNLFHKRASLVLIHRPRPKVRTEIEYWINIYPDGDGPRVPPLWLSETIADAMATRDRIACVKVTGAYITDEAGNEHG